MDPDNSQTMINRERSRGVKTINKEEAVEKIQAAGSITAKQ